MYTKLSAITVLLNTDFNGNNSLCLARNSISNRQKLIICISFDTCGTVCDS